MDGCIRALGFVLYPYVFVVGPNKQDCSHRTRLCGNFCHIPRHLEQYNYHNDDLAKPLLKGKRC